jgi:hypothetical protein
MRLTMKQNNSHSVNQNNAPSLDECTTRQRSLNCRGEVMAQRQEPQKPSPHAAEAVDAGENPPESEPASSIDTIVEILSRGAGGAKPSAANWRETFLCALAKAPIVAVAARIAGVSRRQAFEERNNDRRFARLWDEAMEYGIDEIEAAAYLSAVFGNRKPLYQERKQVGWSVDHSRPMQTMLLQSFRPGIFGKKEKPKGNQMKHMTLDEFEKRVEEAMQD